MEMSLGGDMVQLIVVEWLEAIQHTWEKSCEGRDHAKLDCFSAHIRLREPDKSEDKAERSKGVRKQRRVQRGSTTQKRSVGQKGGGLGGVPQCHRGGSTDREERDADARQGIVGPWAWQHYGTAEAGLPWSHRSLALMEGVHWLLKGPRRWRIDRTLDEAL
ncbi:hypothetical protein GW17_00047583 [Ensete ventricosum]|nr:hypothetical protein GW17_00047583 [Ensete ventricosum]